MLKKSITYEGFDGEVTKDFYFNLTTPELLELDAKYNRDLSGSLQKCVNENDMYQMVQIFGDIIRASYGERTITDEFVKNEETSARFMTSPAYDALFLELFQNPDKMTDFITAISPKIK